MATKAVPHRWSNPARHSLSSHHQLQTWTSLSPPATQHHSNLPPHNDASSRRDMPSACFQCNTQWVSGKILGIDYALLPNRECNQKQKHKKQPWSNVECFAFSGAIVRFASLETSFHAANHTIPPPPSHEGHPHCAKDKNRSPFHGEKPLKIILW